MAKKKAKKTTKKIKSRKNRKAGTKKIRFRSWDDSKPIRTFADAAM